MADKRIGRLFRKYEYDHTPPAQPSDSKRHEPHPLPAAERARVFEEAVLPLTALEALEEASRCLRCDIREERR